MFGNETEYAVVHFSRWSEDERPRALVIYSSDGGSTWHDVVECDPDSANDIVDAFMYREYDQREKQRESAERLAKELAEAAEFLKKTGAAE